MAKTIYCELFPHEKAKEPAEWAESSSLAANLYKGLFYLPEMKVRLLEYSTQFKNNPTFDIICASLTYSHMAWQIIRKICDITSDDIEWYNKRFPYKICTEIQIKKFKELNDGCLLFIKSMKEVDNIMSFFRHPCGGDKVQEFDWIIQNSWDNEKKLLISFGLDILVEVYSFIDNDFCSESGWEDERTKKKGLLKS